MKKLLPWAYLGLSLGLLVAGILFEAPQERRFFVLLVLGILFMALALISEFFSRSKTVSLIALPAMVLCLAMIDYNAKFAVNYFFHALYILLTPYIFFRLTKGRAIAAALFAVILSMVKFFQLALTEGTFSNVALLVFFGTVQLMLVVTMIYVKSYQQAADRNRQLYEDLYQSHEQLKAYAKEIRETSEREAGNIAVKDLHDALGQEIKGLVDQVAVRVVEELSKVTPADKEDAKENNKADILTPREKEICHHLSEGLNNREIGDLLFISEGTVKNNITKILDKLELRDRTQLALFSVKSGL